MICLKVIVLILHTIGIMETIELFNYGKDSRHSTN
jgi:hypothetical protein